MYVFIQGGELQFTGVGEIQFNAYKDWYVQWGRDKVKVHCISSCLLLDKDIIRKSHDVEI